MSILLGKCRTPTQLFCRTYSEQLLFQYLQSKFMPHFERNNLINSLQVSISIEPCFVFSLPWCLNLNHIALLIQRMTDSSLPIFLHLSSDQTTCTNYVIKESISKILSTLLIIHLNIPNSSTFILHTFSKFPKSCTITSSEVRFR